MMTFDNFVECAKELQRLNHLDEETASHYMSLIGDTPELSEDGKVIVREDDGREIARVVWGE